MRKFFASVLVAAMAVLGVPVGAFAAGPATMRAHSAPPTGTLNGFAQNAAKKPLPNYTVRVRTQTGTIAGSTTSNAAGAFTFPGLNPGGYVVEIVNAAGEVVGTSAVVTVTAGATVAITVSAAAVLGMAAAATGTGFSLFGLGTLASVAVVGAAGITAIAAVRAARNPASPVR